MNGQVVVVHICNPSYTRGEIVRPSCEAIPRQKHEKKKKTETKQNKKAECMAQVVRHLLNKCKVLNSNTKRKSRECSEACRGRKKD
jgi:hypothetical protein